LRFAAQTARRDLRKRLLNPDAAVGIEVNHAATPS
jgi:hypothetical protein